MKRVHSTSTSDTCETIMIFFFFFFFFFFVKFVLIFIGDLRVGTVHRNVDL